MRSLSTPLVGDDRRGFTLHCDLPARELITPVGISEPYGPGLADSASVRMKTFEGVWDTGATCSVISRRIVEELMLTPIDTSFVETASGAYDACDYLVAVYLPGGVVIPTMRVIDSPGIGGADALIGMDIIGIGDLAITNMDDRTCMSFQMPSSRRIDFMERSSSPDR